MKLSDTIQLVIALATCAAAVAAWKAARESSAGRQEEARGQRIARLRELLSLVAGLVERRSFLTDNGERYVTGAYIRSLIPLTGCDLPEFQAVGRELAEGALNVGRELVSAAEKELRQAIETVSGPSAMPRRHALLRRPGLRR